MHFSAILSVAFAAAAVLPAQIPQVLLGKIEPYPKTATTSRAPTSRCTAARSSSTPSPASRAS
jgi:hypothetical protein